MTCIPVEDTIILHVSICFGLSWQASSTDCPIDVQAVGKDTIKDLKAPEEILKGLGANYSKASADWGPHVEIDSSGTGPLVTGNTWKIPLRSLLSSNWHPVQ